MRHVWLAMALVLAAAGAAGAVEFSIAQPPFHIDWTVTPAHRIEGRVHNEYHTPMTKIRLLVEALDPADHVVARKFGYVFGDLMPRDSRYFEVRELPAADHYRVSVESYDQLQFPSGNSAPH